MIHIPMDLDQFRDHFRRAAVRAHEFAAQYITEPLPPMRMFRVRLNQSYDRTSPPDFERHPEDSSEERARQLRWCDEDTAISALWRGGKIPQWADLAVIGEQVDATLIQVLACGRFTDDDDRLYHIREGYQPFHVLGPALPARWDRGTRFSIHEREECWGAEDVLRLATYADKVWSLYLCTDEFDADELAVLPALPRLEILEHRKCALAGRTFAALSRFPALRIARLQLVGPSPFAIGSKEVCPSLTDLSLDGLTAWDAGTATFPTVAPNLRSLVLEGPIDDLSTVPALPGRMDLMHLTLPHATEESLLLLLNGVRTLDSLSLRGTPVGDAFAEAIARRWSLGYLDLVRTKVSPEKIEELSVMYPRLKMYPRPKGQSQASGS